MRCMACGAEMILVKTIEDVSMPIAGFERRAYMCSLCHETEQRFVFNKRPEEREPEPHLHASIRCANLHGSESGANSKVSCEIGKSKIASILSSSSAAYSIKRLITLIS